MRGPDEHTHHMFSYLSPEQRVPADHPLRAVRALTDHALKTMSRRLAGLYAKTGRPSIPPEQLLRALVLQVLYTVRSERLLMEELNYNLLFRWFVGLNMDDPVWHPTTFTKNRDRLLAGDVAAAFFDAVRAQARAAGLLSDEHFTVDGTQLEAWASLKSFQQRDAKPGEPPDDPGNPTVNFHGERRRNDTHASTTDPEALLHRKGPGKEATLAYLGHVLLDHRHGLVANVCATHATGTAERDAAVVLLEASAPPAARSRRTKATTWRASWPPCAACQGRSKIRPRWRRKTRPSVSWAECLNAAGQAGASGRLAALLLGRILPVCSLVAPCQPGAALRNPLAVPLIQATSTRNTSDREGDSR